jgi:hypothetical protein
MHTLGHNGVSSFKINVLSSEGMLTIEARLVSASQVPSFYHVQDIKTGKIYQVHRQRIPQQNERQKSQVNRPIRKSSKK